MGINGLIHNNKFVSGVISGIITLLSVPGKIQKISGKKGTDTIALCFHKLGDSVFTLPALRALRDNLNRDFYIFCFEETKPIFELYFKSDYIIGFSHNDIHFGNRLAGKNIRKKISEINPQHIFDFTGSVTTASVLLFSAAAKVTGINEDYFKNLYTTFIPLRKEPHILDIYLDVIRNAFPGKSYEEYKKFPLQLNPEGYILIHPFAGWAAKEWNMTKFIEISGLLVKDYKVAFVSQPGLMRQEDITELNKHEIEVIETASVDDLISTVKKCSLMFSNDSGPAYIANALGRPTFTIFGPTNPEYHTPYGEKHRYIQKIINCSPVNTKYCFTNAGRSGCKSFECMIQLSVEEVYDKLIKFLSELGIRKKEIVKQNN